MVGQLRLVEHYTSIQGEGPHTGEPTQFVRFGGCNMKCPGWPCDTPHAIEPALWKSSPKVEAKNLVQMVLDESIRTGATRVCLTGGEPLLQPGDALRLVVSELSREGFRIDVFSNGSFIYPHWLLAFPRLAVIMDWKLGGSGEAQTKLTERRINLRQLRHNDCVKFVVKSWDDLYEAHSLWKEWVDIRCRTYVGAAWGHMEDDVIVKFIQDNKLPWFLNVQVHKYIWGERSGV